MLLAKTTFPESMSFIFRVPTGGVDDYEDDDGVCQRLGLCGQGESSIHSTGLQSPSFWLM